MDEQSFAAKIYLLSDVDDHIAAIRSCLDGDPVLKDRSLIVVNSADGLADIYPLSSLLLVDLDHPDALVSIRKRGGILNLPLIILATTRTFDQAQTLSRQRGLPAAFFDEPSLTFLPGLIRGLVKPTRDPVADQLETIIQETEASIFVKDREGHYLFINRAGADWLDVDPAEAVGRTDGELIDAETADRFTEKDRLVLETGQHQTYDEALVIHGSERILNTLKIPYRAPDGEIIGIAGFSRDVTERARAEQALRESEQHFKNLAENAPDMIFHWSYAAGFEYVSPSSVEVNGYTPEEHYQDPGLSYRSIHPDDIPIYESVFSELADPEGPRRYCVIRWQHKSGQMVHVEMRMAPIFDERGNLVAIDGIARDITQHVVARQRLRDLTTRLTQAHEAERRRLAHELHDDLGQALTVARLRTRMVQRSLPEDVQPKLALLDDLLDEVLQTVRALSRELRPPLLEELGWSAALEWLCESFSERTGLPVDYVPSDEAERLAPEVELTAYRVVQESLTNAARHAEASRVMVHAERADDSLEIKVVDDGKGFDVAQVVDGGDIAGLGLLGMQERVDSVGGQLSITADSGEGTTIIARLPDREGTGS